jgi:hypothetical protein
VVAGLDGLAVGLDVAEGFVVGEDAGQGVDGEGEAGQGEAGQGGGIVVAGSGFGAGPVGARNRVAGRALGRG